VSHTKADFYDAGVFNKQKALDAYFAMMERFGYPVSPILKTDQLWTSDFAQDDFLNVGMAGVFWVNDTDHRYFAHEIYLLPGQMIVEHRHNKVADGPAKMETWHVRHGMVYTFSDDEPTQDLPVTLPESQLKADGITALHCKPLEQGEMGSLNRLEAPHFMIAGPAGAIVSEYASPHYGDALEFTNKTVVF
jgi:D-lyxose ketol-isomerase